MEKLDLPIFWNTPTGMRVAMSERKTISKKIQNNIFKNTRPISIRIPTQSINYRSIKTGLMPNFIHSLDASNIQLLVKYIKILNIENINLYTIHDCFASDYKNMFLIELLVKKSFADLYFKINYLELIHNSFLQQIQEHVDIFEEEVKIEANTATTRPKKAQQPQHSVHTTNKTIKYIYLPQKERKINKKISAATNSDQVKVNLERIDIPEVPDFNWSINKKYLKENVLFNLYFVN